MKRRERAKAAGKKRSWKYAIVKGKLKRMANLGPELLQKAKRITKIVEPLKKLWKNRALDEVKIIDTNHVKVTEKVDMEETRKDLENRCKNWVAAQKEAEQMLNCSHRKPKGPNSKTRVACLLCQCLLDREVCIDIKSRRRHFKRHKQLFEGNVPENWKAYFVTIVIKK